MKKNTLSIKKIFYLFMLGLLFVNVIAPNKFPDNKALEQKLIENNSEVNLTPQKVFLDIYNNIAFYQICKKLEEYICQSIKFDLKSLGRNYFFIINFIICLSLIVINIIIFRNDNTKLYNKKNSIFITSLFFPSVLLSVSSIGPESIYTMISIYAVSCSQLYKKLSIIIPILMPIIIYAFFLDRGNFFIFVTFVLGIYSFLIIKFFLHRFLEFKYILLIISISILFLLFFGKIMFNEIGNLIDHQKITDLNRDLNALNLNNISILELFYRTMYFVLTLVTLYFADHTFSKISVIFILMFMVYFFWNLNNPIFSRKLKIFISNKDNQILYVWLIMFPFIIISILPTHAYAKYYLFYIPFLLKPIQFLFGNVKMINMVLCYSFFSIIEIFIFNLL